MLLLIIGLVMFLGVHSIRTLAPQWRLSFIEQRGQSAFKGLYSVLSLVGLVFIVIGYGQSRIEPQFIWFPPPVMALIAALLMLFSFVLLAATYVPGNRIKVMLGHPMAAGVKIWAFSHLIANGRLGDMILFGAFLIWAIVSYTQSRKADRAEGIVRTSSNSIAVDSITVVIGIGAWLVFALWAHLKLIGVSPFTG